MFRPVGWSGRTHRLLPPPTSILYMTLNNLMMRFQVMLELWRMQSTPSLPLLPGLLWVEGQNLIGSYLWMK